VTEVLYNLELMNTTTHDTRRRTIALVMQLADITLPQSATLGLHPVACKLLLISYPAEGGRFDTLG